MFSIKLAKITTLENSVEDVAQLYNVVTLLIGQLFVKTMLQNKLKIKE